MNSGQTSPRRAFALQKYLLLHSQHDALKKELHQTTSSVPSITHTPSSSSDISQRSSNSSTRSSSVDCEERCVSQTPFPTSISHHQRVPMISSDELIESLRTPFPPPETDENVSQDLHGNVQELRKVNEQIKRTLTDLLNCDEAKSDIMYRRWVQTRLMDAEKELMRFRSRRWSRGRISSSVPSPCL